MELTSPTTKLIKRKCLDLRFANGQMDYITLREDDTLTIDAVHIRIEGTNETIEHDRGGSGVVGYRLWEAELMVPINHGPNLAGTPRSTEMGAPSPSSTH